MADRTGIEWTDATWNPVTGCTKVSAGCDHCYADTIAHRFAGTPAYPNGFQITLRPERLDQPLRWRRPRRVFVNSMSDLFHHDIPTEYVIDVFAVMALAPQHTFQVLTKRPGRMRSLLTSNGFPRLLDNAMRRRNRYCPMAALPLPNVWLGVSTENQHWADIRIPQLLATPAAIRFISAEPLLGPIDLRGGLGFAYDDQATGERIPVAPLDWVIAGGESGAGHRPIDPDWVRAIRDQCAAASVAFFFKQWGGRRPKENGNELDGRTWQQYPGPGHG